MSSTPLRKVWFYRDYRRFTGGHLKHAHYFDHVRRLPGFEPVMTLARWPAKPALREQVEALWGGQGEFVPRWAPGPDDVLFLGGQDWRHLAAAGLEDLPNPRINLVQGVRHASPGTELGTYLAKRALRICVSAEVADAVLTTGTVNGPVFTIPNGLDMAGGAVGPSVRARGRGVAIVGYKQPTLARELSTRLDERNLRHETFVDFVDRGDFLALLGDAEVAVCLPWAEEGFYLPALEAMASGCTVVTMDCVGNRSFCRPGDNCLIGTDADSLADATQQAVKMSAVERDALRARARETVCAHTLDIERARFHAVLRDIDRLWHTNGPQPLPPIDRVGHRGRLVDFMIVGAQKCGTTMLSQFLAQHSDIGMSSQKEVHLFDAPDYKPGTDAANIDVRYRRYFEHAPDALIRGEATPIYMYLPDVATELKRYNADLKLIVLLRDPVDRALSDYYMQKARGRETKPLWLALLCEPWRLWREADPRRTRSETREHGYRSRGLYSLQLRRLYRHFDRARVLVVRRDDLLHHHDDTVRRVLEFLGVPATVQVPPAVVLGSEESRKPHRLARVSLRLSYLRESVRLRRLGVRVCTERGHSETRLPACGAFRPSGPANYTDRNRV